MMWLLERGGEILSCEIRRVPHSMEYEFAVSSPSEGTETVRFRSAVELINGFLLKQASLEAQGWRPRRTRSVPSDVADAPLGPAYRR